MKKRILSILLVAVMLISAMPVFAVATSADEVTVKSWDAETITLYTPADFKAFHDQIHTKGKGAFIGQTVKLGADIDMTGITLTPFSATEADGYVGFAGTLDGQYHTLSGITMTFTASNLGMFGNPGNPDGKTSNVHIKNLALTNTTVNASGKVECGVFYGMVNAKVLFENVYNTAVITGGKATGGFIGCTRWGGSDVDFKNCVYAGTAAGANHVVSGFIGYTNANATNTNYPYFENCVVVGNQKNGSTAYEGGCKFIGTRSDSGCGNVDQANNATYIDCIQYNDYFQTRGTQYAVCQNLTGLGSGFDAFGDYVPVGYTTRNSGYPVPTTLLPFFTSDINGTDNAEGVSTFFKGIQYNEAIEAIRFVGLIELGEGTVDDFASVGFEVYAYGPTGVMQQIDLEVTKAYTSITEEDVNKTAEQLGGDLIYVANLGGAKLGMGVATFVVKTYTVDANNVKTYTDMNVVTFGTVA